MRLTRVHVAVPLAGESHLTLRGSAANHIARVLRLNAGDALTLFDGRGGEYAARIAELHKDTVRVQLGEHRRIERESPLAVTLGQGISRGERMDWVVQKATELGVRRIVPLMTERSVVRLHADEAAARRLHHWCAIAAAACEQCGRNTLPEISTPRQLDDFLGASAERAARVVLSPGASARIRDLPADAGALLLLVGPEGGLTDAEQALAVRAGFVALSLGPRILRTETAAIAALAALQQYAGDL